MKWRLLSPQRGQRQHRQRRQRTVKDLRSLTDVTASEWLNCSVTWHQFTCIDQFGTSSFGNSWNNDHTIMLNNAKAAQLNTDKTQMYQERQKTLTLLPASALCHSPSATLELLLKFSSAKKQCISIKYGTTAICNIRNPYQHHKSETEVRDNNLRCNCHKLTLTRFNCSRAELAAWMQAL